ncbi:type II toxin-antitoxin system VapC family toxin [Fuscovulum blasticum]|uniref:type II toxin-antitoxin system VapC family toxin n=1 Tax=Fuscovulum blasticum TaxID=1075 RepID=UPI000D3E3BE3|nr:type II toxin-antitoxin system VapC family toxin [Fuscovulum blasticum]AWD23628.1 VapC toxin family PIN domain ribonuclease [Fuscovulum blasticum]
MMFLLDTNVISELRRAGDGKADANVTAWLGAQDAGTLFISAITVMELEIGVRRIERRDSTHGGMLRAWLTERVLPEFEARVLPVDMAVALRCAGLHVPDPRSERDALIAATALVHGFTMVTRNFEDFKATGAVLLNPWDPIV